MSADQIPQRDAGRLLLAAVAGREATSSLFEVRFKLPSGGMGQDFIPVRELDRAVRSITNRGQLADTYLGACPRTRREGTAAAVDRAWTLWVDVDTPEALSRLREFRPLPSIVIRSGTGEHVHAWWPLKDSLSPEHVVRANRRLALALGSDRAATDAARIMRAPGTLNHKADPPRPVVCVRLEPQTFAAADIIRGLPDDPAYAPREFRPRNAARPAGPSRGGDPLAGLARVVRESAVGERNHRLNWAAYRAGEHVTAGTLNPDDAHAELLSAALDAGLGEHEAARTITSGLTAAERRAA